MKLTKKLITTFLAITLLFTRCITTTQAASKNYMSKMNVSWDLKPNKIITDKTMYADIGMIKQQLKITNYKIKNSSKKGYKELTFTLRFSYPQNIKPAQVHKIINSETYKITASIGGGFYYAVLDYNTGKYLGVKNKQKVTVEKVQNFTIIDTKHYSDNDGCSINLHTQDVKVKVTYPRNYKGLCIAAGGSTLAYPMTSNESEFFNGNLAFGKTSYYSKKDKSVAHFMRVTK